MKRAEKLVVSLICILLVCSMFLSSFQALASLNWSDERQITFDSGVDRWPVVVQNADGKIFLVFVSDRTGNLALYMKTSTDEGYTWTTPQMLVQEDLGTIGVNLQRPSLLVDSRGVIWITWHSQRSPSGGDAEIWYITSIDNGTTWSVPVKPYVGDSPWNGYGDPFIIEAFGKIWIFFHHHPSSQKDILWCFTSSDYGTTWSSKSAITSLADYRGHPSAMMFEGELWLFYDDAFSENPSFPESDLYLMKTQDGLSWTSEQKITSITGCDQFPSAVRDNSSIIHVFFDHTEGSERTIQHIYSSDNGTSWSSTEILVTSLTLLERTPGQNSAQINGKIWLTYQRDQKIKLMYAMLPVAVPIKGGEEATIESNVTVNNALMTMNTLHFDVSGPSGSTGWLNITFPMVNKTNIKVFINREKLVPPPWPVITKNATHYFVYFEFTLSTHEIIVKFWWPYDITGDDYCGIDDLVSIAGKFSVIPGHEDWHPVYDVTDDDYVGIDDIVETATHFGETA